jgi:hypothetical protein
MTGLEELITLTGADLFIQLRNREPLTFEVTAHQKRLSTPAEGVDARTDVKLQVVRGSLEEAAGVLLQILTAAPQEPRG